MTISRLRRLSVAVASLSFALAIPLAGQAPEPQTATTVPPQRPTLTFADSSRQSTIASAYASALHNLLDINTVRYNPDPYNQTGLLSDPPGFFIRAGGGYSQPWTRDAAINSWNGASLLEGPVARNTLFSVLRRQANGKLIIQQDNQWWDKVIWITAAWNHYLVTGDKDFLPDAYEAAVESLAEQKTARYNKEYSLFMGPSFFNDGIAGYPVPPATPQEEKGSFVLHYPRAESLMALSTNCVYYSAYRSAAAMAAALGKPAADRRLFEAEARSLKRAINSTYWMRDRGMYGYLVHNGGPLHGQLDKSEEGTGQSLAILFDIADAGQARSILSKAHIQPAGIVDVYPHFPRYKDSQPGRHNAIVWPMIQGLWATAAAKWGDETRFSSEVLNLARLAAAGDGHFFEIYDAQTGAVTGGWQSGHVWKSQPEQTWSATAYLSMIHNGLFGMHFTAQGLELAPLLPHDWGEVTLSSLTYRQMTLSINLRGEGSKIARFAIDGRPTERHVAPADLRGAHVVDITLRPSGGSKPR